MVKIILVICKVQCEDKFPYVLLLETSITTIMNERLPWQIPSKCPEPAITSAIQLLLKNHEAFFFVYLFLG